MRPSGAEWTVRQPTAGVAVAVVALALMIGAIVGSPMASASPTDPPTSAATGDDATLTAPGGVPGRGTVVVMARPTWDTGWFQAAIVAQLLTELGYVIDGPTTTSNDVVYPALGDGDIDLWVNGWFPLHEPLIGARDDEVEIVGFEVRGGALQGYLADRATIDALGIESLADLADPEVAAVFDHTGDGVADLIGCEADWACAAIVEHHLDAYGLRGSVEQVQGDYGPLMQATVDRYRSGEPVLFYTFTPNWTIGALTPGDDVAWIPAPFPSLPAEIADQEPLTEVPGIVGCLDDPCSMGFAPNDIRAVANRAFLDDEPAVRALLERFTVALDDISAQNAAMIGGEDTSVDIEGHAARWIEANRADVDAWLGEAVAAHVAVGLPLGPAPAASGEASASVGTLRVVTRLAPPYVSYADGGYEGFSIDLLQLVADDIGAELDVYAVNSTAKLIDDIDRGEADIGAGAIAITANREHVVDFSQPYLDSGLQILVADRSGGLFGGRVGAVLGAVFSLDVLFLLLVLLAILVVAAHVIWFTERRQNPDFPESYGRGIWESLWWAAVTATTVGYGDKTPTGVAGRIFGLFWMFSGLFVLAYFTAGIATAFTLDELSSAIHDPADLRGRAVGAPAESLADEYLAAQGIPATRYPTSAAAFDALVAGEVDAVVDDAAILQHFVATDERGGSAIAGLVFAERGVGFALPPDAAHAEAVNRSLLTLVETGRYEELRERWFGAGSTG